MKTTAALTFGLIAASALAGCSRDIQAKDQPQNIEQQYGVSGAYTDTIPTPNGSMNGTVVPVTLADGRTAQLFIPGARAREPHAVYLRENDGLHPPQMKENATREQIAKSPAMKPFSELQQNQASRAKLNSNSDFRPSICFAFLPSSASIF